MIQEEKQLLLADLCARLPYGVMCVFSEPPYGEITEPLRTGGLRAFIEDKWKVKPYLRPMSSMTDEELKEYHKVIIESQNCSFENSESATTMVNDYLLSKHFDVRGLITKGLAIEAPKGMYK